MLSTESSECDTSYTRRACVTRHCTFSFFFRCCTGGMHSWGMQTGVTWSIRGVAVQQRGREYTVKQVLHPWATPWDSQSQSTLAWLAYQLAYHCCSGTSYSRICHPQVLLYAIFVAAGRGADGLAFDTGNLCLWSNFTWMETLAWGPLLFSARKLVAE